jgi:hypothetical protein
MSRPSTRSVPLCAGCGGGRTSAAPGSARRGTPSQQGARGPRTPGAAAGAARALGAGAAELAGRAALPGRGLGRAVGPRASRRGGGRGGRGRGDGGLCRHAARRAPPLAGVHRCRIVAGPALEFELRLSNSTKCHTAEKSQAKRGLQGAARSSVRTCGLCSCVCLKESLPVQRQASRARASSCRRTRPAMQPAARCCRARPPRRGQFRAMRAGPRAPAAAGAARPQSAGPSNPPRPCAHPALCVARCSGADRRALRIQTRPAGADAWGCHAGPRVGSPACLLSTQGSA